MLILCCWKVRGGTGGGETIWNIPVSIDVVLKGSLVTKSELVGKLYRGKGMALTTDRVAMIENR